MRKLRVLVVAGSIGIVLSGAMPARADGGAYVELDKTYYLSGDTAVARTYVLIPKRKIDVLDRGPFYLFALPAGTDLREGRAIPDAAVRLATLVVQERNGSYELSARFTMPSLAPGNYTAGVCNDPCTISGFREPLSGWFTVVATVREAQLLRKVGTLRSQGFRFERKLRHAAREIRALQESETAARASSAAFTSRITDLEQRLRDATALAESRAGRPTIGFVIAAVIAAIVLTRVALFVLRRRRGPPPASVGPIEEPIAEETGELPPIEHELARTDG
jgi:hypothetical protein